ncbi:BES1/BZR1 homolog protein 4-like isoform X2 [Cucurbita maxima]|uniref:Protein BZR1 homolog n=1 Tax=Cucurbita maxima TaxID=3661 RepID=A0A6J1KKV9_CUCMA|nr:BES1/BZR1 homolog protein 4-like isoform X1 [Cucurbita maxima]XP_023000765.1 BES1/BZR1 homolog protein 4-like isoform X2 [Cucurbita maxima]
MTSGTRMPTWKERENNKRRERRRRAIAAKIFLGLRMYGNYKLPKHCDNNEVLKALCVEAGWTVEEDGTTYRKGCKPVERDIMGGSASASPCSSYQPSPCASYNPSPASSSFPSPSRYAIKGNDNAADPNSLIPWLKNLSSASSPASSRLPHHLYITGGSISAPVTPPSSSPTARTPRKPNDWDNHPAVAPAWAAQRFSCLPASTPPSPGRQVLADSAWLDSMRIPQSGPSSPTFSLVARNPFGFKEAMSAGGPSFGFKEAMSNPMSAGGSRNWTPTQSGTCSPTVAAGTDHTSDVPMTDGTAAEFAFESCSIGLVKPWEGERIHEECISDDLELTLGNSRTR